MASPVYVWDGSAQDDSDATWNSSTISHLTLEAALAVVDANGRINIASEHIQTQSGVLSLGSANNNVTIVSLDKDNSDAYLAMRDDVAPGSIAATGGAGDISFTNSDIYIGLTFSAGDDINYITNDIEYRAIDCKFRVADNCTVGTGNEDASLYWEDVIYEQVTAGRFLVGGSTFIWRGGTFSFDGGSVSTQLFEAIASRGGVVIVEDVDIQDLGAGDSLVSLTNTTLNVLIKRCKVPSALGGLLAAAPTGEASSAKFHSVSNSNIIYQFQENYHFGQINEDTSIFLDATYDGTNGYSAKMVSSSNALEWVRPLKFKLAEIWATANPTITVELIIDSATTLNDDDVWLEIEYPDSTTGALGGFDNTSRAATIVTTPIELTTSGKGAGDWTGEGGTAKFYKIAVTISSGQAGVHTIWACLAKPSTTIYVDPKIVLS